MDISEISNDIIAQAAGGDTDAFEQIYRAASRFVYNIALRMVNDPQDAEEITQDVFVRTFTQLNKFRFESSLKTWIYRIAVNTTLNFRKKRSRQRNYAKEYREAVQYESDISKPRYGEQEDHQKRIDHLLGALNPDQRACIVLRNMEGLTYEEIAQALNININTVRTRLRRAREKLLSIKHEVVKDEV